MRVANSAGSSMGSRLRFCGVRGREPLFCTEEWLPSLVFDGRFPKSWFILVFITVFNNVIKY